MSRSVIPVRVAPRRLTFVMGDLGGGTGDHLLSMMRHWDRRAWAPHLISEAPRTSRLIPDIPVAYVRTTGRWDRFPVAQLVRLRRVAACLRREPADLVHTYFYWPIVYGRLLKLAGQIDVLVENREDEGFAWGAAEYWTLRRTRRVPDRVICVSEAVRRVALEREGLDPKRVLVVGNGVAFPAPEPNGRADTRAELGYGPGDLVVGMVASPNRPIKGVAYLLEAVPAIVDAVPRARFVIFGRGHDDATLLTRAAELGIERQVQFAGFRPDIHRVYPVMDLSVMTSLSEGLSIALLESMSHGLPVVVTRVGGNPEVVVEGETGFLVPPRDAAAFAERVVTLLRDPELRARMGQAARRRVEERFDIRQAARRYLEIYEELLP